MNGLKTEGRASPGLEADAPCKELTTELSAETERAARTTLEAPSFVLGELAAYRGTNYELIPLHSPDDRDERGRPIGKAPMGRNWRMLPHLDVDEARAHMDSGHNVGVRLAEDDLVVDVDPRNFREGDDPLARLEIDLGIDLTSYPRVITGSGGYHIYMKKPAGAVLRDTLDAYQGIEFKAIGRQVVAPGSVHPETGRNYRWDDDILAVPLRAVRAAPVALVELARRPVHAGQVGAGLRSPEELGRMLTGLDPMQYRDHAKWLELMMACHHATAGEGRDEFIEWSTGDPTYASHGWIIGRRWDSLHAAKGGRLISEKTLFKALVDAGKADLLPPRDAATDFPDDLEELAIGSAGESGRGGLPGLIEHMNERFCAVLEGGKFRIFMEDTDDVFDPPRTVWTKLSRTDFRHFHENTCVTLPDEKTPKNVADIWLKASQRRQYPGIVMDPEDRHPDKLNLWRGWAVEPAPGDWSLMQRLIDEILCSGEQASSDYVRRWIGYMLQHPGRPAETAIAFRGAEGTGKSTLGRALMQIAGAHGLTVASPTQFAGRFNAHLRNVAFLFADEAFVPGGGCESILKQLVTEPVISYEPKGVDVFSGRNLVHLMMASNEKWFVPASMDARRFAVFDVADTVRNDRSFFGPLHKQMQQGGLAAMVHDLLALDLEGWHPSASPPRTAALGDQKLMSLDPAVAWWLQKLQSGTEDFLLSDWGDDGPLRIGEAKNGLLEDFRTYLARQKIHHVNATHKALVDAGDSFGLSTAKVNGGKTRIWVLPPLSEARANFEARIGANDLFG